MPAGDLEPADVVVVDDMEARGALAGLGLRGRAHAEGGEAGCREDDEADTESLHATFLPFGER